MGVRRETCVCALAVRVSGAGTIVRRWGAVIVSLVRSSHGYLEDNGPVWDAGGSLELGNLASDTTCDLCVVGLGGSGLSAVREATSRGLDVVGIDAAQVAAGAAGRNGGFLLAGIAAFHHDAVEALGAERAVALYRQTLSEVEAMSREPGGLVRRTGSLRIAATQAERDDCERQLERMLGDDLPAEPYSGPEGDGILFPLDAVFDPLARCRRLAREVISNGARLFGDSRALTIGAHEVVTGQGSIECDAVIVAVDGGLDGVLPELAGHVRTARLQMLATAPTSEVSLPRPVYRRYGYEYYQQLPDGRIALGGFRDLAGPGEWTTDARPTGEVQSRLDAFLREVIGVQAPVTHRWAARVGYARGVLPVFARSRGGVVAIGGYSGTGNVVGALLGREAVAAALGDPGGLSGLFGLTEIGSG